ncbi:MAG TPA: DUF3592 domain-containing protein [Acidobacteriaceae bacterium]|jgi:hypothetical protein|nr:DUF3592 domain-containing protein [Acidobacteriaceae bacterium]
MALFADDLIRGIIHTVRKSIRLNRVEKWPTIEAKVQRFRSEDTAPYGHRLRPVLDYSYEMNGETQYGSAYGIPTAEINKVADAADNVTTLRVRYDPANPAFSQMLSGDNPDLPFGIEYDYF